MEDFFAAGGLGAVLRELEPLLELEGPTVTGETLPERLEGEAGSIAAWSGRLPTRASRRVGWWPCSAAWRRAVPS